MANEPTDQNVVRYTVKELLTEMRGEQQEQHRALTQTMEGIRRDVRDVSNRVKVLEDERLQRKAVTSASTKLWVGAATLVAMMANIPAAMVLLRGG